MPKQIITSPGAPTTGFTDKGTPSPLAQAIRAGNLLFVSGQGPLDPKTREVASADIREQTRQTLSNLVSILSAAGLSLAHVVNSSGSVVVAVYVAAIPDGGPVNPGPSG